MSILLSLPRLACAVQCTLYLGYTQISPELTSGKSAECVYLYFYCTLKQRFELKSFWSSVSRGSVNNWKLFNLIFSFHPEIEDKRQKLCGATSDLIRICGECFLYFLSPSRLLAPDCGCLQSDEDQNTQQRQYPPHILVSSDSGHFLYLVSYHFLPPPPRRPVPVSTVLTTAPGHRATPR